jgi:hypothetical protein
MPVLVYGRLGNEPFAENTETVDVSSNGGYMAISAPVTYSQRLILTNLQTNEELACRVARIITNEKDVTFVGLEFLQPSPRFWGASGPQGQPRSRN